MTSSQQPAFLVSPCWADPLSKTERRVLAAKLARACKRSYDARIGLARPGTFDLSFAVVEFSAECSSLHLDVTERAA